MRGKNIASKLSSVLPVERVHRIWPHSLRRFRFGCSNI